eukprot:scaffold18239_cov112-Isochrysis_galbana.AAC.6
MCSREEDIETDTGLVHSLKVRLKGQGQGWGTPFLFLNAALQHGRARPRAVGRWRPRLIHRIMRSGLQLCQPQHMGLELGSRAEPECARMAQPVWPERRTSAHG